MNKIISHIINFVLIISILIFCILAILKITVLNKEYFLEKLNGNNYYHEIYENIIDNFENNLLSSGIDENVIETLVTEELVTKDIQNAVNSFYENTDLRLSTSVIVENFERYIETILSNNNRILTEEEQKDIKLLENKLIEIYENEITYIKNNIADIYPIISILNKTVVVIEIVLGLVILNLFAIIIFIIRDAKKNTGISLLATGIINLVAKVLIGNGYHYILFINKAISKLVISIISDFIQFMFIIGVILSLLGLVFIIVNNISKEK